MNIKLGIVMDPIESINYKKDSSLAMLWAASDRGWDLFYMEAKDLFIDQGDPKANASRLKVFRDPQKWFEKSDKDVIDLDSLDVVLMRKDPPFDNEFIYNTYILEAAEQRGTLIVNKPSSLRDCNEKIFATQFPQCCPPHRVTSSPELLRDFHKQYGDVIFKPLDGMGGSQIFRLKPEDPNVSVIIETLTAYGTQTIMAQEFLPAITEGDKRILIVDGEPMPFGLARIPASGETRGNLAAGGRGEPVALNDRDYWICEQIIPTLNEKGLLFVGLDVIGDHLTEINVTSPTCIREIDNAHELDIAGKLMDAIEKRLAV
ncbi:Glutathione synthetase [BD1-7 clade bacterium]|uniref:Glutathione synthetase n=1 Tax=BD1-7 clade bacterium TaxID=2029982 RepID=A0A5S9QEC2_9GAMM|nr:Glutathione synthetase [BD1-7 clade bacterium]